MHRNEKTDRKDHLGPTVLFWSLHSAQLGIETSMDLKHKYGLTQESREFGHLDIKRKIP